MNLAAIAADQNFLEILATRWLAENPDTLSRGLILLPTRRAARGLAEAFLRVGHGKSLLLPRITALGALDEAPLSLAGALDLPPAVEPALRLAMLSRLILALPAEQGGVPTADRAWMLAQELASLMDEAERTELDLPDALARAAGGEHAEHWRVTLQFLDIVTRAWPNWLSEQGFMNPAARQVALLKAQEAAWRDAPPEDPVWIAGATGGIPAVARLLKVAAGCAKGRVILPGVDFTLDEDSVWQKLDEAHPQAGLARLLRDIGARRDDITRWEGESKIPTGRTALLSVAMLPAHNLNLWRSGKPIIIHDGFGLSRLAASDQQEEAAGIAMILRDALHIPSATAALVTPDRALAGRVAAELLRWGVVADDSAGEKLMQTPPAVFLRLVARAVADGLAPVALLAVLKHPFAGLGLSPQAARAAARAFEIKALRGPKPMPGIAGLRKNNVAPELLARLEACLEPVLRVASGKSVAPVDALSALIEAAEALAATDETPGPARLWAMEEGEALAAHLTTARAALVHLPDQPPSAMPGLLDALLEGEVVRSRRALRGRDAVFEHPRVFIWGLLEARLQSVDTLVLGGLVEGVWPPTTDPGPWMSRPMRKLAGLPSPEEIVGQAAHDFVAASCAARHVVLSCPRRRDGAPAVPARWLARLDALLAGQNMALPLHPAALWVRRLDQPAGRPVSVLPPRPAPALRLRPRRLSVTEIQTWLEDPYAIYAKHVLGLRKLKPLEEATDAADYGSLVHDGLKRFLDEAGTRWPPYAGLKLREAMDTALLQADLREALRAWWRPRLYRIADWVAEQEVLRRSLGPPVNIAAEVDGRWHLDVPGGFTLRGRADRIELRDDGLLSILDYKTGALPAQKQVEAGFAPQLPLEAAMAAAGAFAGLQAAAGELVYWHLTGGFVPGEARSLFKGDAVKIGEVVLTADAKLRELIMAFDDPARAYLSQPHPGRAPRFSDYAQLARVSEWDLSGDAA